MYREDQSEGSFMMGMLTGVLVGAGLALMLAPKSGSEMRAQLGEQYRGLAGRVGEQTQHLRDAAGQWRQQGRSRTQQLSDRMTSSSDRQSTTESSGAEQFPSSAPSV